MAVEPVTYVITPNLTVTASLGSDNLPVFVINWPNGQSTPPISYRDFIGNMSTGYGAGADGVRDYDFRVGSYFQGSDDPAMVDAYRDIFAAARQLTKQAVRDLKEEQTVAAPAPAPSPAPVETYTAPPPIDASLEGSPAYQDSTSTQTVTSTGNIVTETETSITTRTNGVDIVVDKAPVVSETETQTTTRIGGVDIVVDKPLAVPPTDLSGLTVDLPDIQPDTGPEAPSAQPPVMGLSGAIKTAAGGATAQDQAQFMAREDWRVRLALSPGANYLYKAKPPGILQPLTDTDGVIFPYTPAITVNYAANYEGTSLTHTNYKIYQYQNSSVDQVQITCEFTAQDVKEANYVLAVIHFFRSMTKMFYGQDSDPKNGTPPPLCYLYGMGGYQFDALPLAISGFTYSLPQDVDYIKTVGVSAAGTPQPPVRNGASDPGRLGGAIQPGGKGAKPNYGSTPTQSGESATWVPTKINISVTCLPVMSRNQVSNYFSLKNYATGNLIQGTKRLGGGMW